MLPSSSVGRLSTRMTSAVAGSWFDIAVQTADLKALPVHVWADNSDAAEDEDSELHTIMPIKSVSIPDGLQLQLFLKS